MTTIPPTPHSFFQVEVFRVEKRAFDREVGKWDDQGNEVILLAKVGCSPASSPAPCHHSCFPLLDI